MKIYAVLIGLGLALPLLRDREWMRTARMTVVAVATLGLSYSSYGLDALKPVFGGLKLVTLPSPWRVFELTGQALGRPAEHHGLDHQLPVAARAVHRRLAHLPADLLRSAARGRGAVRADVRLDPRRPLGVRLVHRGGLGRADPGAAQPDDPVADPRHGPARPLPVQRWPRGPDDVTALLARTPAEEQPQPAGGGPRGPGSPGGTGWPSSCWPPAWCSGCWPSSAYRPALFYIDTTRYLYNVARGMDPVGYKGPLRAILFVANFGAVAAVQHLLGLAMAVVIYVLLLRRGVSRWLAALAIAPVLLDAYQIQIEQTIMPDTWFEALIVAGLAILLWRPRAGLAARSLAAGLVLGTSATFAQVGEALILPAVIYLLAAGGGWRRAVGKAAASVRGLRRCRSWPTARSPTWSPGTSSCPTPASRPSTGGRRPPWTAPRSGCRPPSGRCAPPPPSRPRGRTGWSTSRAPRSGPTTPTCRGPRPTA